MSERKFQTYIEVRDSTGRIVIPKQVRDYLKIVSGTILKTVVESGQIQLIKEQTE